MLASKHCLDCGTELSQERWSGGLCPRCLLELALESPSLSPEASEDPDVQPTLAYSSEALAPGRILGRRYQIRSLLGRGGMGEVWRAFDLKLRVDVALKALRRELLEDDRALELLRSEVRSAREVMSPNVCRLFDLVELDGQELVSMEYIDGKTLLETLHSRGPLELEEAREIASQFLAGLEAIHAADLVHRDLKPENLMITRSGRVVVMDFGIAKGLAEGRMGTVSGTPAYMAPEQARGEAVDARADVFSAGVVLAEMIAPAGIRNPTAREAVWRGIHSDPPEVPDTPWTSVLKRAVAHQRDARFDSASALARALEEVTFRVEGAEDLRPYPGLASFTEEDAEYFFGRELEVEAMWRKLRRPHLLGLIGPSGAGKSSFLRAGLLPVMPEGWRVVISTPGNRPVMALSQALVDEFSGDKEAMRDLLCFEEPDVAVLLMSRWRQQHEQALIIVDQFEELFTQNPPEVQARFAELLGRLAVEADVHVLLSMRDDFLYHCHGYAPLAPLLDGLTLMSPPAGAALRRAVVQPALKCGYRFEDEALVEEILSEVREERGALPMLAFATARLWEKRNRDSGLLTREAYAEIGGVSGSLAQHAEATLERIGLDRIPMVREIFRNLVTAQGTRAARRREELLSVFGSAETAGTEASRFDGNVAGSESDSKWSGSAPAGEGGGIGDRKAAAQVLNSLIDARLLTSYDVPPAEDEDTGHHRVEIIHESLLSAWPRLVRWQSQDADSALLRDELRQAAQTWDQHGRSDDLLWTGNAFTEFQLWRSRYPGGLTATEEAFAQAMTTHAARRKRRRRVVVAAAFAILLAVVGAIGTMWHQSETARQEEERARREAVGAQLVSLGRLRLEASPTAALAYALASLEEADSEAARLFALEALWRGPTALVLEAAEFDGIIRLRPSPDGRWLATRGMRNGAVLWSRHGGPPKTLQGSDPEGFLDLGAWSPDSKIFVTKHQEKQTVRHWSIPEGEEIRSWELDGPTKWAGLLLRGNRLLDFTTIDPPPSPNGWGIERVRSWPLDGGEPEVLGRWDARKVTSSDIDPGGSWLAYAEGDLVSLRRLDALATSPPQVVGRHPDDEIRVRFHPHGDRLVSGGESGEVRIWSVDGEGEPPLRTLRGKGSAQNLALDPQDRWLAAGAPGSGETHHTALLWGMEDPPDTQPVPLYYSHTRAYTWQIAFDPEGRWLLVPQWEHAIFWALSDRYPRVLLHGTVVVGLAFTPDGRFLASTSGGGTVRLWPLSPASEEGVRILHQDPTAQFLGPKWAPKGDRLLLASHIDGRVFLLPRGPGEPRVLQPPKTASGARVFGATFDHEGQRVVIGWGENVLGGWREIRIWDLESGDQQVFNPYVEGEECPDKAMGGGWISGMHFLPDGRLLTAGTSGVRVWDLEEGTSTRLIECRGDGGGSMAPVGDGGEFLVLMPPLPEGGATATSKLLLLDPVRGMTRPIPSHSTRLSAVAADRSGALAVTGDEDGVVRVGPLSGGEPHLLLGHTQGVWDVAVSPDGRWVASASKDGTIRLWPMPDLDKPPLHTLPYEELLAKLRTLTNLRVVEEEGSTTGYRIDVGPFPGWEEVPTW